MTSPYMDTFSKAYLDICVSIYGAGGLLWHAHVSELSDNDKAAIMQIKELKDVLNGHVILWALL